MVYGVKKSVKANLDRHFTEIYYDPLEESTDQVIERVLELVFKKQQTALQIALKEASTHRQKQGVKQLKQEKEALMAFIALLTIGFAFITLTTISNNK